MNNKKAETCIFNANRDHINIALPFCKWIPVEQIMPPHIAFKKSGDLDFSTCKKCKAYKAIDLVK